MNQPTSPEAAPFAPGDRVRWHNPPRMEGTVLKNNGGQCKVQWDTGEVRRDDPDNLRHADPAPEAAPAAEVRETRERLLSVRALQGPLAYFAVTQHPYRDPPRLAEVMAALEAHAAVTFDGPDIFPTAWFSDAMTVERWVRTALEGRVQDVLTAWNTPRIGSAPTIAFSSRYGGPLPERDFIDIDALLRNVAMMAWREAAEYEREVGTTGIREVYPSSDPEPESELAPTHALVRTSPKGGPFVGRCIQCGAEGLPSGAALEPCSNPRGLTQDGALLSVIEGDE